MSLDICIHGSGYGECIILTWHDENNRLRGALVDGFSDMRVGASGVRKYDYWLEERLRKLELSDLDFCAITHPHDDHIRFMGQALTQWGGRIKKVWYWNQLGPELYLEYLVRARWAKWPKPPPPAEAYSDCAWAGIHVETLLKLLLASEQVDRSDVVPVIARPLQPDDRFTWTSDPTLSGSQVVFNAISPSFPGAMAFTRDVCKTYARGKTAQGTSEPLQPEAFDYANPDANRVSLGLMVTYGESRVLLGGDMEEQNWREFRESNNDLLDEGERRPSVIKVSHHGSRNGTIPEMWQKGFFGMRPEGAVAVVTPWRPPIARKPLPETEVLEAIRKSGYRLVETGCDHDYQRLDDHVRITVDANGGAPKVECVGKTIRVTEGGDGNLAE